MKRQNMDQAMLSPDGRMLVTYGTSITRQNAQWLRMWHPDGRFVLVGGDGEFRGL